MQSKSFHAKVWKVSLENTTTWKTKSSTYSLDLCVPNKLAQITVHKNGATVKNVKRCQPVKNACAVRKFQQLKHFI